MLGANDRALPEPVDYDPKETFTIVQLIEKAKALHAENQTLRRLINSDQSENEKLREEIRRLKNESVELDVILENLDSANSRVFELKESLETAQASQLELQEALGVECNSEILTVYSTQRCQIEELKRQLEEKESVIASLEKENLELRRGMDKTEEMAEDEDEIGIEWSQQKAKTMQVQRHSLIDMDGEIPSMLAEHGSPMSKSVPPFQTSVDSFSKSDTESLLSETKIEEQRLKERIEMKTEMRKLSSQILDLANARHNEQILRGFVQRFTSLFGTVTGKLVDQVDQMVGEQIERIDQVVSFLPCLIIQFGSDVDELKAKIEACRGEAMGMIRDVREMFSDARNRSKEMLPGYIPRRRRDGICSPRNMDIVKRVREEMREIEKRMEVNEYV